MEFKTLKLISIFLTFILCFPFHFMYEIFPNTLFSIMFPVNESIWEHMKMLFSATLFTGIIECLLIKNNNKFSNLFITSLLSIPIFLALYLPLYKIFNENVFINISVLIVTIIITQIISYIILKSSNKDSMMGINIIGIILVYILFGILTYYPLQNEIFYDNYNNKYGINTYDN